MSDKGLFDCLYSDDFTRDYIIFGMSETRSSASLINSYMQVFDSEKVENWSLDERREFSKEIKRQCCHIMQASELYNRVYDVIFADEVPTILIDMKSFFESFTVSTNKTLHGLCIVDLKPGGEFCAKTNLRMLGYAMILYVRSAILEFGAVNIKMTYTANDNDLIIESQVLKKEPKLKEQYPDDDFYTAYQTRINDAFVRKLGGEMRVMKDRMKIIFPNIVSYQKPDEAMQEYPWELARGVLNMYNIVLSDLSGSIM